MIIPEGLIAALKEASESIREDARATLADELYGYAAMLAAAPTPPAQEDELVGYVSATDIFAEQRSIKIIIWPYKTTRHNVALYTHPVNDGLRKAAEEIENILRQSGHTFLADNLRAELDKGK